MSQIKAASSSKTNDVYTNHFVEHFDEGLVEVYDQKFKDRFEKNIKHKQQVALVQQYVEPRTRWLDFPIGSGRLIDNISSSNFTGADKAASFLNYNRNKGRVVKEADLFDNPFDSEFDVVTCLHTLFAFDDFETILKGHIKSLRQGGVLIVDIVNKAHIEKAKNEGIIYTLNEGWYKSTINRFFSENGCEIEQLIPHDYWDNLFFLEKKKAKNSFMRRIYGRYWRHLNKQYFKNQDKFFKKAELRSEQDYVKFLVVARKK